MTLRLEKITPDNVDAALQLRVRPEQERNVASVTKSLAEAYAWGETAWPRLIFETVGVLDLRNAADPGRRSTVAPGPFVGRARPAAGDQG